MIELNDINGKPLVVKRQDRKFNCGQTAVAMVTGKSLDEVYKAYGTKSLTYQTTTPVAIRKLGYECDDSVDYKGQKLPDYALVRIGYYKRSGGHQSTTKFKRTGHLVVYIKGWVVDPNGQVYPVTDLGPGKRAGITHFIRLAPKNAKTTEMVATDNWLW